MGLITSLAAHQNVGLQQFDDRIEPVVASQAAGNGTTATFTTNAVYAYKFRVAKPITVANAELALGATSAGSLAIGIYTSADGGVTLTRVSHSGSIAAGTANAVQVLAMSPAYTLVPGVDYWVAFGLTDGTLAVLRVATLGIATLRGNRGRVTTAVYSSGVPSPLTPAASGAAAAPWIALTT